MFWEIADELYALTREVLKETKYSIHFEINERAIHVWILFLELSQGRL